MGQLLNKQPNPRFSSQLPIDEELNNFTRQVSNACFSLATPKPPLSPQLVHVSSQLLYDLGMDLSLNEESSKILTGAKNWGDFKPYAMCYGGHQFGNWAGQLGDGRAINISEVDVNGTNWKFQLKGAGPTPYSRGSDGLAVLRSSVREYLCSEAMFHLNVPTTRALSLALTGDKVTRDVLYDGNPKDELGAIVCRVSESFIRFGSFEIFASRDEHETLKQLVDYTIKEHYAHLGEPSKETYIAFFKEVTNSTKEMIIHWQRVGFVHGVMNTDNMSILGQTIDYGPYGWLEDYDPEWTPNTTDAQNKRYRFENQPSIALWNLFKLANALYPLVEEAEPFEKILDNFKKEFFKNYHKMMLSKIGLYDTSIEDSFINDLTDLMAKTKVDMTIFFRSLSSIDGFPEFWKLISSSSYLSTESVNEMETKAKEWFGDFKALIQKENVEKEKRKCDMNLVNPKYVLRNYMAQLAIEDAEKGDYKLIDELYDLLKNPYDEQSEKEKWFAKRPKWADNKVGCSMLSCSS